ncbi:MAG: LodA/GoxA family CTQ-dependent oxidase [Thermoanaerobaculia bacterium]
MKILFVDQFQGSQIATGEVPATRPVFRRTHGVAHGTFVVNPNLPDELRVGVFAQKSEYPAWVRFSSDVQPGKSDYKGTVGIGIKLFGVKGPKVMEPDQDATTQDFILQNFDIFFVDNATDMCLVSQDFDAFVKTHPKTQEILDDMAVVVNSVLETPFWGVLPTHFGPDHYCKYKIEPEIVPSGDGKQPDYNDPFYLRGDLHTRLKNGEARLKFMVQMRTDPAKMPLDEATVRWSEELSPPIHVATLVVPQQDLDTRGQADYGENLAINTWHTLAEHQPAGSLAEARKVTYRASARVRRDVNGVPLGEPVEPRPAEMDPGQPYPPEKDLTIVSAKIHPAIGIARMGNSEEFFVGPEVVHPEPKETGFYRDGAGALKRQAARFRIYGYNAAGQVVRELRSGYADVHWTVHVANRKAGWYQWVKAMDIPESADIKLSRRNKTVTGAARQQLDVDGGERGIEGTNTSGEPYHLQGEFQGTPVYLGELRTDERGRLLFLGGRGVSASPTHQPIYDTSDPNAFINANGWYDDASDGPVTATVTIEGREIPVEPAWVVTAPPNYAPDVVSIRTLYDLLVDLYVQNSWVQAPARPSFTQDVYPILQRMSNLQWVNKGFATQFGHAAPTDFENPALVARLARDPAAGGYDTWSELRRQVFNSFRLPEPVDANPTPWPWEYGDSDGSPSQPNPPGKYLSLSPIQYHWLRQWAAGEFVADWPASGHPARGVEELPAQEQPAMLDRAALHFCLADAFHPGCEVTWPIRHISMFTAPFRIRHRPAGEPEPDYGDTLTQAEALAVGGPLWAQGPGDLTKWMGLPWQADTAWCRSGYDTAYDPYLPTFWPARVPNQVLSEADYRVVVDPGQPREVREAAYNRRADWNRLIGNGGASAMLNMVHHFADMGVMEVRPGVQNDPLFPPVMMVENAIIPLRLFAARLIAAAPAPPSGTDRFHGRAEFLRAVVQQEEVLLRSAAEGEGGDGPPEDASR